MPVEFVSRALALIYDARLDLRKASNLLIVGDVRVPKVAVRFDPLGNAARLTIDATPRAGSTVTQDGDHLTIRFDADALDALNPPLPPQPAQGIVQGVRLVDATTLAVDLGPRFAGFRSTSQPVDETQRLVLDLLALVPSDTAAPPGQPARVES